MKKELLEIITQSAGQTQKAGQFFAQELKKDIAYRKKAVVIGLVGDLGSGKTTFIQGLAQGLGIKQKITSPTFVLLKKFNFSDSQNNGWLYHIDCYRLDHQDQLIDLGFEEIICQSQAIVVLEWAEKVKKILPTDTWWINFEYLDKNKRKISL